MVAIYMSYEIEKGNEIPLPKSARLCYDGTVKQDFAEQRPHGARRAEAGTAAGAPDDACTPTRKIARPVAF